MDKRKQVIHSEEYREFWLLLSDLSRMKVAVCKDCRDTMTEKDAMAVLEAHKPLWNKGLEEAHERKLAELNQQKEDQLNHFNDLSARRFGLNERDLEE
ncbi:MAG: hypothetical protein AB9866_18990 [Syntrophobacteraceae bacterium]